MQRDISMSAGVFTMHQRRLYLCQGHQCSCRKHLLTLYVKYNIIYHVKIVTKHHTFDQVFSNFFKKISFLENVSQHFSARVRCPNGASPKLGINGRPEVCESKTCTGGPKDPAIRISTCPEKYKCTAVSWQLDEGAFYIFFCHFSLLIFSQTKNASLVDIFYIKNQ